MFDFDRQGRPVTPVKRPGSVAILDRLRSALGDCWANYSPPPAIWFSDTSDPHTSALGSLGKEIEEVSAFVSPIPIEVVIQELAAITAGLLTATLSTSLRCEAVAAVHRQAERLIATQARLRGPGPDELREDLAITAVAVAAGTVA